MIEAAEAATELDLLCMIGRATNVGSLVIDIHGGRKAVRRIHLRRQCPTRAHRRLAANGSALRHLSAPALRWATRAR